MTLCRRDYRLAESHCMILFFSWLPSSVCPVLWRERRRQTQKDAEARSKERAESGGEKEQKKGLGEAQRAGAYVF